MYTCKYGIITDRYIPQVIAEDDKINYLVLDRKEVMDGYLIRFMFITGHIYEAYVLTRRLEVL